MTQSKIKDQTRPRGWYFIELILTQWDGSYELYVPNSRIKAGKGKSDWNVKSVSDTQ